MSQGGILIKITIQYQIMIFGGVLTKLYRTLLLLNNILWKLSPHLLAQEVGGKNKERRKVLNRSLRLEMFSNVFFCILVFGFPIQ